MKYFIQVHYYNPSSHERDWCIVGKDNSEVVGEESAMLFNSKEEATAWCNSESAKLWKPCSFEVLESVY